MARDEAELVKRSQQGDRGSFDELVREHYSFAYNIAYRMLGDEDSAIDAVQTTFVRAYTAISDFRHDASFSTWLYRIVNNVCLDRLRDRKQSPESLTQVADDEGSSQEERNIPDHSADPANSAEKREVQRVVQEKMLQLSVEHRQVLVMYDLSGLSYDEISTILQLPLGTVKSRLNRARHALKEQLSSNTELFL